MPERNASRTAAFVAGLRGSCPWLPLPCQLVHDDYAFKLVPGTYWERLITVCPPLGRFLIRPGTAAHKAVMVLSRAHDNDTGGTQRSAQLSLPTRRPPSAGPSVSDPSCANRHPAGVQVLQVRTRGFDDAVRAELKKGVAQVLILGAGYDARALRLAPSEKEAKWVEIDMPASQKAKRESLAVR